MEASRTIKEDELAIIASGGTLSSINRVARRVGEMSIDHLLGHLMVP